MKRLACPWWPDVGRAVDPRSDLELSAHLESCADCWSGLDQLKRAAAAIRAQPYQAPDADAREQARTRLMAALGGAPPATAPRRLWVRGAVAIGASLFAATAAAVVGTRVWQPPAPVVAPPPEAPAPRRHPIRARASVPAPVPEIQGPPAPPPEAPRPRPRPALQRITPPPLPPAPGATPEEQAFYQGWEAMRAGDHRRAAERFEGALALRPTGVLAEDARYWRAVALGRAGAGQARAAMEEFLRRHSGSPRAGEVSAMLGWLLYDAGEREAAAGYFRAAESDRKVSVQQSARAGLRALAGPTPP